MKAWYTTRAKGPTGHEHNLNHFPKARLSVLEVLDHARDEVERQQGKGWEVTSLEIFAGEGR
jgi:hypothetical protein